MNMHIIHKNRTINGLRVLMLGLLLSGGSIVFGVNPEHDPQRVLLTFPGDPAHTQAVTWRTAQPVEKPQAQLAKWASNPKFSEEAITVNGTGETVKISEQQTVGEYRVVFENLDPPKQYGYRVGDGETWSEWLHFRTADNKPEPFRFLYLGDAQNDIKSRWSRTIRAAYAQAPDARFMIHAGDLIDNGFDDNLWGEWCYGLSFIGAEIPVVPTPGNHDLRRAPGDPNPKITDGVTPWWHRRFTLPANGPEDAPGFRDEAYYFDYQGLRLISLDANVWANEHFDPSKKQTAAKKLMVWLENVLNENPNLWTIVTHHQTIYSIGENEDNVELRAALQPLYDKHHVDLVLQGHDHNYVRTSKIFNGSVVTADQPGTIYMTTVAGPKMYENNTKYTALLKKNVGNTQMYQVIDVAPNTLTVRAYAITGELLDAFELKKNDKGSSVLTELPPTSTVVK